MCKIQSNSVRLKNILFNYLLLCFYCFFLHLKFRNKHFLFFFLVYVNLLICCLADFIWQLCSTLTIVFLHLRYQNILKYILWFNIYYGSIYKISWYIHPCMIFVVINFKLPVNFAVFTHNTIYVSLLQKEIKIFTLYILRFLF